MEKGLYTSNKVDFSKFASYKVPLHLTISRFGSLYGCGASALGLVTGANLADISKLNKERNHYTDQFMISFLEKKRIKAIKLTQAILTNSEFMTEKITSDHFLLASLLLAKQRGSWCAIWQSILYHNMEITNMKSLDFLNFPILSCYVLFKKSWNKRI